MKQAPREWISILKPPIKISQTSKGLRHAWKNFFSFFLAETVSAETFAWKNPCLQLQIIRKLREEASKGIGGRCIRFAQHSTGEGSASFFLGTFDDSN